jgi:sulfate adenylyltransferase
MGGLARWKDFSTRWTITRTYCTDPTGCFVTHTQHSVVETLRLASGALFPIPVNFDISKEEVKLLGIKSGVRIALRDPRDGNALAILTVEDIYTPNKVLEAEKVFGADDPAHPAVAYLRNKVKELYIGGKVQAIQPPTYFDYVALRCELTVNRL